MDFSYTLIQSQRKTISLEIRHDGTVLVRAPKRMSDRSIREFVQSKEGWLRIRLEKITSRPSLPTLTVAELDALKQRAKEYLPTRAALFAPRVGVSYGRITIRAQHTRWGSCSRKGNLNFNCVLMLAPSEIRDYVVIHELCHRKHMNHSPAFWAEMERFCPDYRNCRRWLKENGSILIARLPE